MHPRLLLRSIGANFLGGIWAGALIVLTTPLFVARLGLEGFAFIGFWQLLALVSAVFDFGLGASLIREFARYQGSNETKSKYRNLLYSLEWIYLGIAAAIGLVIALAANWLAGSWLKLLEVRPDEAALLIRLMAGSIALQFLSLLYSNALSGMQHHAAMNSFQMLGNSLKYLGGVAVLLVENSLALFFSYQILTMSIVCWLTRRRLLKQLDDLGGEHEPIPDFAKVRQMSRYSAGMFLTALCGLLLANIDRIALSKIVPASDFGKYTLAFTATGLLQMVILAFYRTYYPKFSELKVAGDEAGLKKAYYQGCRLVGAVIIPTAVAALVFAPKLFQVWLGYCDNSVVLVFRLLIVGTTLSGLMWLPAALQQAVGWTRLHVALMILALALGIPFLFAGIYGFGLPGATAMVLVHGAIEITLGLWLMNRVLFPRENLRWYGLVIVAPTLACLPVALLSVMAMPADIARHIGFVWLLGTGIAMLISSVMVNRRFSNG